MKKTRPKPKKKVMDLYYEAKSRGHLPRNGLCRIFYEEEFGIPLYSKRVQRYLDRFEPTGEESINLEKAGIPTGWWGYGRPIDRSFWACWQVQYKLTPLRENVMLLIACMNGELK